MYGHIWFLTKLAEKYKIIEDLNFVFEYDQDLVNDIITLAIFPYLTNMTFDRCEKWQNIVKTPSNHKLTSSFIARITQNINDNHRMEFIVQRLSRQIDGQFVVCNTSIESELSNCHSDIYFE